MSTTLYTKVDYSLSKLIEDIDMGELALPDIQRPFVWSTSKVRDLFDSMYRGYPVGYLLSFVSDFLEKLKASKELKNGEEKQIPDRIERLYKIKDYPFTAIELSKRVDEEQVSQVFVRINSKGVTLNQADFILTLMSVFWDEVRIELEKFCRDARKPVKGEASPYNHFIEPDPDQLLRVAVGLGFYRARLKYVYNICEEKIWKPGNILPNAERNGSEFLK